MITALLLAAGSARRFGAPKLLQDLHGKPVVRWSAELLRGSPVDETIVVVPPDHEEFRGALAGLDVRFVVNPHADRGMGSSLACGVSEAAGSDAVLVVLADEPMLGREALLRVVDRHRAGGASIVAPTYRGIRGHPVLFDRCVFAELRALSGDRGARAVVDRELGRVAFVELDEAKPIDVDTPADLTRLRSPAATRSLLDDLMPEFDVRACYGTDVRAPVAEVYRAALETDLLQSLMARALVRIRSLGSSTADSLRFADLPAKGPYFALEYDPPREVIAGVIGRFWMPRGGVRAGDRNSFFAPLAPGTAKAAWSFRIAPTATGSRLTTETRVLCADADARRRFRRYWRVIGPFSGLLRKEALRLIREQAQYMSANTSQHI